MGRLVRKRGWVKAEQRERWNEKAEEFFTDFDVLLTPALARRPPKAGPWSNRSWLANLASNAAFAPFAAPWNFAGYPAAAVPAGMHPEGTQLAVQLVAPRGAEGAVLQLAAVIEEAKPWPRHAPLDSETG
jgi:amidase